MIKLPRTILLTGIFLIFCYPFIWLFVWMKKVLRLKTRYRFGRIIIKACNLGLGVKIKITNKELLKYPGNVVFFGNHQSDYDILALISRSKLPICAMAKKEVRKYPLVGNISYFIDCTYLDRNNLRQSIKVIDQTAKKVANGDRVIIFPEGTRTRAENKDIGEFKPGAFKVALNSQATIIPFAIDGSYTVLSFKTPIRRTKIRINFAQPIKYEDYQNLSASEVSDMVREIIATEYQKIRLIK